MNKVTFGLKNVHYANLSEEVGKITYEKPIAIPGSVEITLEPKGEMTEFFADDILYYSAGANQGYDGTLTIANIPDQFAIDCLGEEKHEEDGVITEVSNKKGKNFALLFEFDGDAKATRHVLYYCSANRPNVGSSTKTTSSEPNTSELTFTSSPRPTDLKVKTKTTTKTYEGIYNSWFEKVYEEVKTVENSIEPVSAIFDKQDGNDNNKNLEFKIVTKGYSVVTDIKNLDTSIQGENWRINGDQLIISKDYLATLSAGNYSQMKVEFDRGNIATFTLEVKETT